MNSDVKKCTRCKDELSIANFSKDKSRGDGLSARCRQCSVIHAKENRSRHPDGWRQRCKKHYHKNLDKSRREARESYYRTRDRSREYAKSPKGRYTSYKASAKYRGILFNISLEYFESLQGENCAYCGETLKQIALDRIDSDGDYTIHNIVPCCDTCNYMKHVLDCSTFLNKIESIVNIHNGDINEKV